MTKQSLAIVVLVSYLLALLYGAAESTSTPNCMRHIQEAELVAQDAIALTIEEIKEVKRFVGKLVNLKSLQFSENAAEFNNCADGITENLSELNGTLYRLKHLKLAPTIIYGPFSLKDTVSRATASAEACRAAIGDVDPAFIDMLMRKLNDLSLILDDVVYRVYQLNAN